MRIVPINERGFFYENFQYKNIVPMAIGNQTIYKDVIYAEKYFIPYKRGFKEIRIRKFASETGNFKVAIYSDKNNYPDKLIKYLGEFSLISGNNFAIANLYWVFPKNPFWVIIKANNNFTIYESFPFQNIYYISNNYLLSFPTQFPSNGNAIFSSIGCLFI